MATAESNRKRKQPADMTVDEASDWVESLFSEETAAKFKEQKVDGAGLVLLAKKGSKTQLSTCGFELVGEQMKLLQAVETESEESGDDPPPCKATKKPSAKKVGSDLQKRIYNAKKKAVRAAVIAKWPGNNLPNFKKQPDKLKELENLVLELEEECAYPVVGFNRPAIRQHILDILNERRRHVRQGRDYTKVGKAKAVSDQQENDNDDGDNDDGDNDDGANPLMILSSEDSSKEETIEEGLSLASARIIVACAFNELKVADVTRAQLQSAAKTLKIPVSSTESRSKDVLVVNVSKALIEQHFISVPGQTFSRDDVKILKPF